MKQLINVLKALRFAGLLAIVVLGLVSIIGTGGGGGGGGSSAGDDDLTTYYRDRDGDGYGDPNDYTEMSSQPQGYVVDDTDCDDTDASIHPGAVEVCGDAIDNDCDGQIDEGCATGYSLVPDTGQATCYDVAGNDLSRCPSEGDFLYGQDGCYAINPPSFTKLNSSGEDLLRNATEWAMVRDNVTGLIWEVKTDDGGIHNWTDSYDWSDAADVFISQLNDDGFGGYTDWRLPTKKELVYMLNYGTHRPAINTIYFPNTIRWSHYWSSTPSTLYPGFAWRVNFSDGTVSTDYKESAFYVRAVRGRQAPLSLTDNGDGTITDNATGRMWMQATAEDKMNWPDALAWCESLSLAGYDDWRLPTIKEIESIVNDVNEELAINSNYFSDTMPSNYWSSTTRDEDPAYAWHVSFSGIKYGYSYKTYAYYVRAVRGGQ